MRISKKYLEGSLKAYNLSNWLAVLLYTSVLFLGLQLLKQDKGLPTFYEDCILSHKSHMISQELIKPKKHIPSAMMEKYLKRNYKEVKG